MQDESPSLVARTHAFARMFLTAPVFLLLSLIPWLLAALAYLLSLHLQEAGRDALALAARIVAIAIAAVTGFSTVWFVCVWIVMLARSALGLEPRR